MNSVRPQPCQTSRWTRVCLLLIVAVGWPWCARAADGAAPAPPPPPWQSELTAARALQVSLLLTPARDEAEEKTRRQRLATVYRQLAAKYPAAAPAQQAAGDGLAELESASAGIPYWQRAATLDPKNAEALDAMGAAYLQMGQAKAASEQYQRSVDVRPDVAESQFALANVQYLFRHELIGSSALPDDQAVLRVALEHFRRAAELSPGDLRLAKAYAETFYVFAKPDWAQALAAWQAVLALSGNEQDFANGHLARISIHLGKRAEAEAYLASIHDPAFNGLKATLTQQIGRMGAGAR